jgi:hypothetical protein
MREIKHQGTTVRVPRDVVARARKAGDTDFDWYAGRLDETPTASAGSSGSSSSLGSTLKSSHRRAVQSHRKARSGRRRTLGMMFAALWQRAAHPTLHRSH